jgi:hypothetical protein
MLWFILGVMSGILAHRWGASKIKGLLGEKK